MVIKIILFISLLLETLFLPIKTLQNSISEQMSRHTGKSPEEPDQNFNKLEINS